MNFDVTILGHCWVKVSSKFAPRLTRYGAEEMEQFLVFICSTLEVSGRARKIYAWQADEKSFSSVTLEIYLRSPWTMVLSRRRFLRSWFEKS